MDPADGVPFINLNGVAARPTEVLDDFPQYTFVPIASSPGLFDLKANDQYLAINLDGVAVFTDESSNGEYVTEGDSTFITSIFSYSCDDGELLLGIPGIVPFILGVIDGNL